MAVTATVASPKREAKKAKLAQGALAEVAEDRLNAELLAAEERAFQASAQDMQQQWQQQQ